MERSQVLSSARLAGQVKRYHTWPTTQSQTVAEHTWHVMRIWFSIFGPLPPQISTVLLWHDCGEIVTGDLPYPFKAKNPDVKALLDRWEAVTVRDMAGELPTLDEYERMKLKLCDLMEMHEFGRLELALGNKFGTPIVEDTYQNIMSIWKQLLHEDKVRVTAYLRGLEEQ